MARSATSAKLSRRRFLAESFAALAAAGLVLAGAGSERSEARADEGEPTSSGFFESDRLQIHYEIFGKGKPIILVHGWGVDLNRNWVTNGWVEALRSVRQVVALDCRGHGRSSKPHDRAVYSYATMARDVLHLMDHLKIPRPISSAIPWVPSWLSTCSATSEADSAR